MPHHPTSREKTSLPTTLTRIRCSRGSCPRKGGSSLQCPLDERLHGCLEILHSHQLSTRGPQGSHWLRVGLPLSCLRVCASVLSLAMHACTYCRTAMCMSFLSLATSLRILTWFNPGLKPHAEENATKPGSNYVQYRNILGKTHIIFACARH